MQPGRCHVRFGREIQSASPNPGFRSIAGSRKIPCSRQMSFCKGAESIKHTANQGGQQSQPTQVEFYSPWLALNFDKIIHSQGIVPQLDADEKLVDHGKTRLFGSRRQSPVLS